MIDPQLATNILQWSIIHNQSTRDSSAILW